MMNPSKEQMLATRTHNFMYEVVRWDEQARQVGLGLEGVERLSMEKSEMMRKFISDIKAILTAK